MIIPFSEDRNRGWALNIVKTDSVEPLKLKVNPEEFEAVLKDPTVRKVRIDYSFRFNEKNVKLKENQQDKNLMCELGKHEWQVTKGEYPTRECLYCPKREIYVRYMEKWV